MFVFDNSNLFLNHHPIQLNVLSYIEHCNIQGLENNAKDIETPSIARNRLLSKAELFQLDDFKYFLIKIYAKKKVKLPFMDN